MGRMRDTASKASLQDDAAPSEGYLEPGVLRVCKVQVCLAGSILYDQVVWGWGCKNLSTVKAELVSYCTTPRTMVTDSMSFGVP
jgi:hypothetical protein